MKLSAAFVLAALFLGGAAAQADDETYSGMYGMGRDEDNTIYFVDATTIATPAAGHKVATVYRIGADGIGNIESWEFRCKDLAVELLSQHNYQKFDDGTWGDVDVPPKNAAFIATATEMAMGQAADFVCHWPKLDKSRTVFPFISNDPKMRIEALIVANRKVENQK